MPKPKLPFAMMRIPLIISGLLYFGLGALLYAVLGMDSGQDEAEIPAALIIAVALFSFALGAAAIIFACIVHKKSKIIYLIAFITTILYLPSAYILLGIPMLLFLLRKDVRDYYGIDI